MSDIDFDEQVTLSAPSPTPGLPPHELPSDMPAISLAEAVRTIVEKWDPLIRGLAIIHRDGKPDIVNFSEVQSIYNRPDFPKATDGGLVGND